MVTALRRMGADYVFDTDFTADLTIMEEAHELIERITKAEKPLPMFTSCCPGWIKHVEHNYPEMIPHISSCKSPQQMMGALIKSYFAEQEGIDPNDIYVISVMPCTAKKYEAKRPEMGKNGIQDVDAVLTTREIAGLIDQFGIEFARLPEGEFDQVIGQTSGSGDVFAASGGVMESAIRTAYNMLTGAHMEDIDFTQVRGFEGIKEAEVTIGGNTIKVAVVNTLGKAGEFIEHLDEHLSEYAFIEVMACPGGCVGGGGQIYGYDSDRVKERIKAVYDVEKTRTVRRSYQSERIQDLYSNFLEHPGSERGHTLLHTTYYERAVRR
jgi:iron-only hydrogenase group A